MSKILSISSVIKRLLFSAFILSSFIGYSQSSKLPDWALGEFVRPKKAKPLISPNPKSTFYCPMNKGEIRWEESDTFNPAATVKDGKICVLYRAEDNSATGIGSRTSRIGLAESKDGIQLKQRKTPVLYPDDDDMKEFDWPGGCEDPRVAVTEDGTYVMAYTSWNHKTARLSIATSKDLITWEKHGPAFAKAYNGRFTNRFTKAASIVTSLKNDQLVITKINGQYFMYWGEHKVYAATSDNLTDWYPVLDEDGELKSLITPRKGYFDSDLTECGPPSILTDKGILMLYNGKNSKGDRRDKNYTAGAYCAGQVLFSKDDPFKVIGRLDKPFFTPSADFEKSGQYVDGTVFIEGLVYFKQKWFLYYGCADSKVGVAIYDPSKKN
ncbi:glycoside hydrolase family 130 protein [Sunxiuqinia sp. A32]|uniref:glycoside hydrolase family 130 protein n=1 Tax=Sunxiuqinia sp. A32 TaxID=3461496 RepID=UPI0040454B98